MIPPLPLATFETVEHLRDAALRGAARRAE
jgi:hypothetical protein